MNDISFIYIYWILTGATQEGHEFFVTMQCPEIIYFDGEVPTVKEVHINITFWGKLKKNIILSDFKSAIETITKANCNASITCLNFIHNLLAVQQLRT